MSSKDEKDSEITIPKQLRTVIRRPDRTATTTSYGTRNLFKGNNLNTITNNFDFITNNQDSDNPQLLAIRNKTAKSKTRPNHNRPSTTLPTNQVHSLLSRPTTSAKSQKPLNSVQKVQKQIEQDRLSISFPEDPIAYFAKRKDGGGHRFIYLNYTGDKNSPDFNPYDITKVPYAEINDEYFTMSVTGVTRIQPDGNTKQVSMDRWAKESSIFMSIRKLKTFSQYYYWRPFRLWKKFVMQQRYQQLSNFLVNHSYFSFPNFFRSLLKILNSSSEQIVKDHLLPFNIHKKFTLEEFQIYLENSKQLFLNEFNDFLAQIEVILIDLHKAITDPQRVKVEDSDFQEIKRKNPNIGQLIILEQKIDLEKQRRNQMVSNDLQSFNRFIRMLDYMILESLAKSSSESFKIASNNFLVDQSSIFQISISFDQHGKVIFNESLENILKNVKNCLDDSFEFLDSLPRLNNSPNLTEITNLQPGPKFNSIISNDFSYAENQAQILKTIEKDYLSSVEKCQIYSEFYSIYELQQTWNFDKYIKYRSSISTEYNLSKLLNDNDLPQPVVFDLSKQIYVDIPTIIQTIQNLNEKIDKMDKFHLCTIQGCLYIDCRDMKNLLNPIPTNCLDDLHQHLKKIFDDKFEYLENLLNYLSKNLKKEPKTLENFVNYCEFVKLNKILKCDIKTEIDFLNSLGQLFKKIEFNELNDQLFEKFKEFSDQIDHSETSIDLIRDNFVVELNQRLRKQEEFLTQKKSFISNYPKSITEKSINLNSIEKLKKEIQGSEIEIHNLRRCQAVMSIKLNDLRIFEEIQDEIEFAMNLYHALTIFNEINHSIVKIPFININIPEFFSKIEELNSVLTKFKKENSLLRQIKQKFYCVYPYLSQIEQLSINGMKERHWLKLIPNFTFDFTLDQILQTDILKQKSLISLITQNAHQEMKLETDFVQIKQKWLEVELPFQKTKNDEYLILTDFKLIFNQIIESQVILHNMSMISYSSNFKDEIFLLLKRLEDYAHLMNAWNCFQSNFFILLPLFQIDELKALLDIKKFNLIKRRFLSLINFTNENSTLSNILNYPSVLDMLNENNRMMEGLLFQVNVFIEQKRMKLPRLNFLSNNEILNLYSITNIGTFNSYLVKLFTKIKNFEMRVMQVLNNSNSIVQQDFSMYRIFGFVSNINETVILEHINIALNGQIEDYFPSIATTLKNYLIQKVKQNLSQKVNLNDWVLNDPLYILYLTILIDFTNNVNECFVNYKNNQRVFINYSNILLQKIKDLTSQLQTHLNSTEVYKLSIVLNLLNYQYELTKNISEDEEKMKKMWNDQIKVQYNEKNDKIEIEIDNVLHEHGYEFYGSCKPFIQTGKSSQIIKNLFGHLGLLFGDSLIGKSSLIKEVACIFGHFIYQVPFFTLNSFIEKLLVGSILDGSWLIFHNIQKYSIENLNFLYENVHEIISKKNSKLKECIINGHSLNLSKNFKFFFTGDRSIFESTEIPDHLKKFLKPIAMIVPDFEKVTELKLNTYGFKSSKKISIKLNRCLISLSNIFQYIQVKRKLIFELIDNGNEILRLFLQKSYDIVDYYESSRTAEEFSIARSIYDFFKPRIHVEHSELFLNTLYSHFQLFNDYNDFKTKITSKFIESSYLKELIKSQLNQTNNLNDYLINQTLTLFEMLKTNKIVCISGPPNSGKSLIVETVKKVIDQIIQKAEEENKFCDLLPVNIFDYYFQADDLNRVFGEFNSTDENQNGKLHSFLIHLNQMEKQTSNFLRLVGPLSLETSEFFNETFCLDNVKLNTLDTFEIHSNFHIIIETNSISNSIPSFLLNCCLLPMEIQFDPLNEFNKAINNFGFIQPSLIELLKSEFVEMSNKVVELLLKQNKFVNLVKGELLHQVIELALIYIQNSSSTDEIDSPQIQTVLAISFFNVFHNFDTNLEHFLLTTFNIQLPNDWVGFNVPDSFWDTFTNPTLESIRYYKNRLIPIDYSPLFNSLITESNSPLSITPSITSNPLDNSINSSQSNFSGNNAGQLSASQSTKLNKINLNKINSYSSTFINLNVLSHEKVCTPQYLPILFNSNLLIKSRKNFLIHGPSKSGKSSLLEILFKDFNKITIPVSQSSTGQSLLDFIQFHTPIVTKQYILLNSELYVLIFDNVPAQNLKAIEFIRMLISKQISNTSKKDPKFLENLKIQNFLIVVTTNDYFHLPENFVKNFYQFELKAPSKKSMQFVMNRISNKYLISKEIMNSISSMLIELSDVYQYNFFSILKSLVKLNEKAGLTEADQIKLVELFLFNLNLFGYHRIEDNKLKKKFRQLYQINFVETYLKDFFENFLEKGEILQTNFVCSQHEFEIQIFNKPIKTLRNSYEQKLLEYNESNNPIFIQFTDSIIQQITFIQYAIQFPGFNLILKGDNYNLAKFCSFLCNYSFIEIPYDPLKIYNSEVYLSKIKSAIQKPLIECLLLPSKQIVIYLINEQIPLQITDLRQFFTLNEIEDLYIKLANTLKIPHDNRILIHENLIQLIHNKVHFIISSELFKPSNLNTFNTNIYSPLICFAHQKSKNNDFSFCNLVNNNYSQNNNLNIYAKSYSYGPGQFIYVDFNKPNQTILSSNFVEFDHSIFLKIHSIISSHSSLILPSLFTDFINSFEFYSNDLYEKLNKKTASMKNAINFKTLLENEMKTVQERKSELIPAIQSLENNDNEYKSQLVNKKADLLDQIQKLDEEERLNTITIKQLNDDIVPLKGEMITQKVRLDLLRAKFNEINESTFSIIKQLALNPSPPFKKLIEFYLVYLDYAPDYDSVGKRLVYDPNFLKSIKEIDPFTINEKILQKAEEIFTENEFPKSDFDNLSPACQILHDWIEGIFKYQIAFHKHEEKNKEYELKKNEFQQFKQDCNKEELTQKVQNLEQEIKAVQNAVVIKESLMEEFKVVESRQRILESLHKGFDTLGDKYLNEIHNYELNKRKIIGNAILFSVHVTYSGYFNELAEIIDELKKVQINYDMPDDFFNDYLINVGDFEAMPEINQDIKLIKCVPKTPLIIDPDCIILNAFREFEKKAKVISLIDKNFKKILKDCLKKGFLLIVEDCNFLTPNLEKILSSYSLKKKNDHISFGSDLIEINPEFNLLLFTTKLKINEIPEDLRKLVTIINVADNCVKSVRQKILCCFLNHFDPEMMPRVNSIYSADHKNNIEKRKYETATFDSITEIMEIYKNNSKYDCFTDDDRIGKLLQSKECYFAAANVSTDYRMILNELRMTIEPFLKSIDLCLSFWLALNRYMIQIRSCHCFSLDTYLELISCALMTSGIHQGIITQQQVKVVDNCIKSQILKWCLPMMSYNESLFYLFIAAYSLNEIQEKVHKEDLLIAVDHIHTQYNSKCDFTIVDYTNGEPLDQLKYTNIQNIFQFVERYVIDNFGDYTKYISYFAIESFMPSNSSTPILIQLNTESNKSAMKLFEHYYILRSKAQLITLSMCLDKSKLNQILEKIDDAMKTGKVVAINYPSSDLIIASYVNEIISMIYKPHPDFRIVFFCSTTDNLPSNVLKKCIRIEFESFPSIKGQMLEIYNHHASVMQSTTSVYLKKQIYAYSLLFSLINYRSFIEPLGFNFEIPIDEIRLRDFFIKLRETFENLSVMNIREMLIDEELGSGIFDQFDYRKLKTHVNLVCSPDLSNDGFFFVDSNSNEIDKWTIPNDVSSLNYQHVVDKIPLFPTTDILSMNSFIGLPLRNWTLSRWISLPFLKLSNRLEVQSNKEIIFQLNEQLAKIPELIKIDINDMKSPLELFVYNEIDLLNKLIIKMKKELKSPKFLLQYRNKQFPDEWKNDIKMNSYRELNQFVDFLNEKHKFLTMAKKTSILSSPVDVRLISNLRGLLLNYINEIAIQRQMTTDVLSLEFDFLTSEEVNNESGSGLKLTNLWLIGGNWNFAEKKLIQPNSKTKPIIQMPIVTCTPVKVQTKSQYSFLCPLYRSAPSKSFEMECDKIIVDGVSDNLQWKIPIPSTLNEKSLIASGVSLICQKPDCF